MGLLRMAAIGTLGYLGYKVYEKNRNEGHAAFAGGQVADENFSQVRDAGPAAMADPPRSEWSKEDDESDASFPASDPPANY